MTQAAYIYEAIRTPRARVRRDGGTLAGVPAFELFGGLLAELSRRGVPADRVDDVIVGVSTPAGEQAADLARVAVLAAGWPDGTPAGVVSRMCCSGLDAIASGAAQVASGAAELVVAGGAESMSRTPMFADAPAFASDPALGDLTGFVTIGLAADFMAARYGFSRAQLDAYAVRSHELSAAAPAWPSVVPVRRGAETLLDRDEGARPDTTAESLASLAPLFGGDPLWQRIERRFAGEPWFAEMRRPDDGLHTVATAPQLADAASAVLIGGEAAQEMLGRSPRGRVLGWAHAAVRSPGLWSGEVAARKALAMAGVKVGDLKVAEINESFSVTPILLTRQLELDKRIVNARGGAVSVGHPLGASGGILLANALDRLDAEGGGYGLLVIPAALGLATAIVIEAL